MDAMTKMALREMLSGELHTEEDKMYPIDSNGLVDGYEIRRSL